MSLDRRDSKERNSSLRMQVRVLEQMAERGPGGPLGLGTYETK